MNPGLPGLHNRFEYVKDLGFGGFGVCKLMIDKLDQEPVAVKFLHRGPKVTEAVEREIKVHFGLRHPNVIGFKCVCLTPRYLCIVMEYALGGELFDKVSHSGRLSEREARFYFRQLVSGVEYCHRHGIAHCDLKLENTLLDASRPPVLKLADFGSCQTDVCLPSKTAITTPTYASPEALGSCPYDGKIADVWSCGVLLFVMLVGVYPFDDPTDVRNMDATAANIRAGNWSFPSYAELSEEVQDLVKLMLATNPDDRMTLSQVKQHSWILDDLCGSLESSPSCTSSYPSPTQTMQEIEEIIKAAKRVQGPRILGASH